MAIIAIDASGGDFAPHAAVLGALEAAKGGICVQLYGNKEHIQEILMANDPQWQSLAISIVHCSEVIAMHEEPSKAVLKKKDASLVQAIKAVVDNKVAAVVSAGHSGAVLVAATLLSGRAYGVLRPVIGSFLPTIGGSTFCLDLGANTDCKPEYLEQFAYIGHAYVRLVKNIAKPRIALLANGQEPYKGSQLVKQTYARLEQQKVLNFIGNIEARDIFDDSADVIVCDGFVGNVLLKTAQGAGKAIMRWIVSESQQSLWSKLTLWLAKSVLGRVKSKIDYVHTGGALLLGVNHPIIIAHGSSNARAIAQAIKFALTVVQEQRVPLVNTSLKALFSSDLLPQENTENLLNNHLNNFRQQQMQ